MATAFVHLLPTAFTSLTDPCLPAFFSTGYKPLAGLIAMVAAFVVVALESYLSTRGAGHSHSHHAWGPEDDEDSDDIGGDVHGHGLGVGQHARRDRPTNIALDDLEATEGLVSGASPLPGSTPTMAPPRESLLKVQKRNSIQDPGDDDEDGRESLELELSFDELRPGLGTNRQQNPDLAHPSLRHKPTPEEQQRMMLQCVLLEAGILFHSVFIGMALSVATGPTFAVFLIAISFHRGFLSVTWQITFHISNCFYRMFRRPRSRHPHCGPSLPSLIPASLADGPRLWRDHTDRPGHRSFCPPLLRPHEPDRPSHGRLHERDL